MINRRSQILKYEIIELKSQYSHTVFRVVETVQHFTFWTSRPKWVERRYAREYYGNYDPMYVDRRIVEYDTLREAQWYIKRQYLGTESYKPYKYHKVNT